MLVAIPAGTVTLSDRRTQRSWPVEVAPFELATVPVTQAEYEQVTELRPSSGRGDRRPVDSVSWWDALLYCNARSIREELTPAYWIADENVDWNTEADGYRLPTEAEWEHACRAGSTGPRYGELDEIAWYRGNSAEHMHDVGGKRPNAWGLYDMLGNTWDWCWDIYDAEIYDSYRVLRGGGWFDEHWSCRASVRRRSHPSLRLDDVGFRVARSRRS
ncbi:formylglycine-generating enzyme family protein [Nocardia ninae]|uniref:Sulfatase-modifying factor enzyme-like domain-containing protein n=1 Tax=Nocardia ninae NBRC 108245 TaxID=1210091 RepID=A0A511M6T1_9NOCA|nr:formylglycine-generating enzyme family protein [Nocardia ninae]GEM36321.1 hypothetical protein NN4_08400 [Nocardia ninae NBRC 108245]